MRQWLTLMIGGLCLLLASSTYALGVGDPRQVSSLNRPLHVVLPLTDDSGLEASQVSVTVADDAAYRQAGLTRSALTDTVSATVERQAGGLAVVLDSPRRVREPFLDLVLVVTWPEGQWQRAVSLLFDPVDYASAQPLLSGDRDLTRAYALSNGVTPVPVSHHPSSSPSSSSSSSSPLAWPSRVTVRPGDSLSTLAASLLPQAGMSRQSLMLALFQSNPAAFVDGDIDRLRANVAMDVPTLAAVANISPAEAASRLETLVRKTRDGRPVIDIVGRDPTSTASEAPVSRTSSGEAPAAARLAMLQQRLSDLTAETERQRATIEALRRERDTLQGALAVVDTPSAEADPDRQPGQRDASNGSVSPVVSKTADVAVSVSDAPGSDAPASGVVSQAVAASPDPSPASPPSLWQRLLGHLDWIGGGLLIALLMLWVWQRRRRRAEPDVSETGIPESLDESVSGAVEISPRGTSRQSTPLRRSAVELDVDSVSISQADIYMAYGRHAEARDWLRDQLANRENAQFRLGLLKALGELRDMDALEQALAGFGDDATAEQRREGQALVDDYRARYVEESWQEATGEVASEPVWRGAAQDVDALFEAQVDRPDPAAARFDPDLVSPAPIPRHPSSIQNDVQDHPDPMSALFDDDLTPSVDPSATSLFASCIDYEAPALELDAAENETSASAPDSSSLAALVTGTPGSPSAMPVIDFSAFSLEPVAMTPPAEPATGSGPEVVFDTSAQGDGLETPKEGAPPAAARACGTKREVPAAWDVDEVEFQPSHRDNGRP
ncbi:FimV/HubP family polar landmark protein [Salinicola sp. CPA57]|uniref:type IV pilus assembly protein FimV n=1 Tax=Salinicola sp. CPA57 TaxID=1949080 RepID=UPI000DA256DA|nr:FimV/HubP family polar landmark protein [Salinicola sp. CPA57]